MSNNFAYIRSTGMYVPPKVVTNDDLSKLMNTSDEWIVQRTGIKERRFAEEGVTTSDLAYKAVLNMLEKKEVSLKEIDCMIFATSSPDILIPGTGVLLQAKFDINTKIPCYDIRQQCSGFIYALQMAQSFIQTEMYKNILIIGAELQSHQLEMNDRGRAVSVLFGDGAGCCVVSKGSQENSRLIHTEVHSDGKGAFNGIHGKLFDISKSPIIYYDPKDNSENEDMFIQMASAKNLFTNAVRNMVGVAKSVLKSQNISISEINYMLPHQANMRINQMVADYLKIPNEKILYNIHKYGNTTAATIPLLLAEFTDNGTINRGDLLLFVAFGAGFTWGSTILKY